MKELEPPDLEQCQCDKPNGNTFMTLGGVPGWVRCTEKPVTVATEVKSAKDGQKGSMSLCGHCAGVMKKQKGVPKCTFEFLDEYKERMKL